MPISAGGDPGVPGVFPRIGFLETWRRRPRPFTAGRAMPTGSDYLTPRVMAQLVSVPR
jgi:hypothetical protein